MPASSRRSLTWITGLKGLVRRSQSRSEDVTDRKPTHCLVPPCLAIEHIFEQVCYELMGDMHLISSQYSSWTYRGRSGRRELAALARTCKTFHNIALDALWKRQEGGIVAICAILPQYKLDLGLPTKPGGEFRDYVIIVFVLIVMFFCFDWIISDWYESVVGPFSPKILNVCASTRSA